MTDSSPAASDRQQGADAPSEPPAAHPSFLDRHLEVLVVGLMAVTAILTAWTGFQSAKWGGEMSTAFSEAGAQRTESIRASNIAGQQVAIDVSMFSSWVDAFADQNQEQVDFYRERFTEALDVATDAWEELEPLENDDAPGTPFVMDEYVIPAALEAAELEAAADASGDRAREANQRSDNYVVISVLLATVLFFAAMSSKLSSERNRRGMLGAAALGLLVSITVIATLPIRI